MIKLKSLLLENKNIIVGIITTDKQVFSAKDVAEHSDVVRKHGHQSFNRVENRWRYNSLTKTVYWWDMWTKCEGEMVMDHLKHKYNVEVLHHILIPDDGNFQKFYNLAHGLSENNQGNKFGEPSLLDIETDKFRDSLIQKYPQLEDLFFYIDSSDTALHISMIRVKLEDRKSGIGSSVMKDIKKFADDHDLTITLSPSSDRGYKKKLDRFYKDLGFVHNKGRKKDYRLGGFGGKIMYRRPKMGEMVRENLEDRRKNIQQWLDDLIAKTPGKDRGEKLEYLWANDPRWKKVVDALQHFNRYKPPHPEAYKAKFQADKYYIRFGDLPAGGKSMNHLVKRHEKGISAYPAKWNTKYNMWELDTSQLSDTGISTLDSMVCDFLDNKGRPIYLLHGQELDDMGMDDTEPLLDVNKIKIIKKLKPEEIWIDEFGGVDWGKLNEIRSSYPKPTSSDEKQGYIGIAYDGRIYAYDEMVPNIFQVDHSEIEYGRSKGRWRYLDKNKTVYWTDWEPTKNEMLAVEDWLDKKGIRILTHANVFSKMGPFLSPLL